MIKAIKEKEEEVKNRFLGRHSPKSPFTDRDDIWQPSVVARNTLVGSV